MRALLFTNLFPSRHEPTRGLFNLRGFEALAGFCDVRIVVPVPVWRRLRRPRDWVRVPTEHHEQLTASYPTYWTLPRIGMSAHADALYRSVRAHVSQLHRASPFDVVLGVFAYPDAVAAAKLAKDLGVPFVAFVLGSDINELAQRPALRAKIRAALTQADSVVAVSNGLGSRVIELGIAAHRVIVQHNGVDGERFRVQERQSIRGTLGVGATDKLIVFVGNLVLEKGPDVLVEALGMMSSVDGTDITVAIIGDGPLKPQLVSRSAALGAGQRVRFLGRLPPERVAMWLSAADALCLPSRREGCPNVVLEALASGRPVVASGVGGVPELINGNNGVMVPPGDPGALAGAIAAALSQDWDPVALRKSVPSLSWDDLGRTLHEAFVRAVNSAGRD